jgi:cytochrome b
VVTFILVIFFLVISGLFSSDDVLYDGPLVYLTPNYVSLWTKTHNVLHFMLYGLIILHLTAVFYYQYLKKHQIIQQIFDGYARNINFKPKSIKKKYIFKGISFLLIFLSLPVIILWYFKFI